jgi:hypothetical protein
MASNTAEQDAWIAEVFGLDVRQYAAVPQGPAAQPSPGQAPPMQGQSAQGHGATDPAQVGAPPAAPPPGGVQPHGAHPGGPHPGGSHPGGAPPAGDGKAAYEAALKAIEAREHAATADVSAGEIASINKDLVEPAKALATSDKHDYAGAMPLLAQAAKRLDVVELHKRRYEAGLQVAENYFNGLTSNATRGAAVWSGWGASPIPHVTAELADVKTKFLDPGRAKAAAGDYLDAMLLLDGGMAPMNDVSKALSGFSDFANQRKLAGMTYDATAAGATLPALKTAIDAIKVDTLDKGETLARAGNYANAIAAVLAAGPRMLPFVDVVGKRNAAATAVNALTDPLLATDTARLRKDRLAAADAMIVAGNLAGAGDLLAQAATEAAQAATYGTALAAAQAELDKLKQPVVASDAARIKTDFVDAAKTRAVAWDYVGATALLNKVPAEAAAAAKLVTAQGQADAANKAAQAKVATAPQAAVTAVTKTLKDLEAHPSAATIAPQLAAIRTDIADAEAAIKAKKPKDAGTILERAGRELVDARMLAERNGQADAELQDAKARVAGLPAEAAPEKATIDTTLLQPAIAKFATDDRAAGLKLLAGIEPACTHAQMVAEQSVQYATALAPAEAKFATLVDPFIALDKVQIKTTLIDPAKARATARDFTAGLKLLAGVAEACKTAQDIANINTTYQPIIADVIDTHAKTLANMAYATSKGLPARPDFAARATEVQTKYIAPAQAKVAARGLGPTALTAMQEALTLATEGQAKSNAVINDTYYVATAAEQLQKATAAVIALEAHPMHAAVASEIAALVKRMSDAAALAAAGQTTTMGQIYQGVIGDAAATTLLANDAGMYFPALTTAQARMTVCKTAVATLAPTPPIIAALGAAEAETIIAAQAKATTHEYTAAAVLLAPVQVRCTAVEAMVAQAKKFGETLATVETALAKLTQPEVAAEVKRIASERIEPAKARAAAADYATALDLLTKATAEAAEAARVAAGTQQAQAARAGAQPALDGADLPAGIAAVQKLLDELLAHPQAAAIKDMTDHIAAAIAAAKKHPPPHDAKAKLTAAADLCVQARTAADETTGYATALAAAEAQLAALTSPVVATDKARIQKDRIAAAKVLATPKTRDFAKAIGLLETAQDECAAARGIVAKDAAFQTAVTAAQAALDGLNAIRPVKDPIIGDDALAVQHDNIDAAKAMTALPGRDYDGATKLLAPVQAACQALVEKKKMAGNTPPTKAEFDAIMAQPGGQAQLDKVVASLPDTTPSAVLQKAIEARFGVQSFQNLTETGAATGPGLSTPKSLKKIYALMAKVPQKNVKDNASLKQIELYGGLTGDAPNVARGSYYAPDKKKIVLSCGRDEDTTPQPIFGAPLQLPNVEPDAEMVPDSEVPVPKYFDWTTLHEVGHAIDDKQHFMDRRAGDAAFGAWQTHGSDVEPVAKAVAKACKIAGAAGEAYLATYLVGAKSPPPAAPPGSVGWANAVKAAEAWCDAIRVGKALWDSGSGAHDHTVDGRVYHEAYGGVWVSYDFAARTKGITGYQFRAPGEWMAELYAAFHSKKLKPSHPAMAWLPTL